MNHEIKDTGKNETTKHFLFFLRFLLTIQNKVYFYPTKKQTMKKEELLKPRKKRKISIADVEAIYGAMGAGMQVDCKDGTNWRTLEIKVKGENLTGIFVEFKQ